MQPVLFTIGPYNAYSFGFFLAISFLFSTFAVWRYSKSEFKEEEYLDAYLYASFVALVSARLFYIIKNFHQFEFNILKYIVVRETPGLSLVGGIIGGFIFLVWYARKKKIDLMHILDIFSIAMGIALFFAKIGEQLGGAGFGKETNSIIGMKIVGFTGRFHPVEIYEAILFFILTVFLIWFYQYVYKKRWSKGLVFLVFTQFTSIFIFLVEFLKVSTVYLYNLSVRQWTILLLMLLTAKPIIDKIIEIRKTSLNNKGA